ncbi:MAG TPA: ribosome-associated translation inhibitor RaiA [Candidatus Onthousia faecavium]|nr:ribosome-associated translation inhibitor RaiA [Candidatus Onthousia faecavium]
MEIIIRGDKIDVTDAMKDYINEKLKKLDKYLEKSEDVRASVVIKIKGHRQTVEITIPLKNFIIRSEETQEDFYAAVDKAIDIMERQIRKNKTKIKAKETKTKYDFNIIDIEEENLEEPETIIKRKTVEVKPMDEDEAILQLELLGHEFYLFRNIATDKEAVVYKRKNGGYGLIEAE